MDNKDLLNMTRWNALCVVFLILILAFAGREAYVSHDLALDRQEVIMTSGDSTVLQPNHERNLIWRSDDPSCVSVRAGKIRAKKTGEALVKASYLWKTVEIPVKVEEPALSEETIRLRLGEQHLLKLLGTERNPIWKVEGDAVSVDDGSVTAVSYGVSQVSASLDGHPYTCQVQVLTPRLRCGAEDISLVGDSRKVVHVEKDDLVTLRLANLPQDSNGEYSFPDNEIYEVESVSEDRARLRIKNAGKASFHIKIDDAEKEIVVASKGDQNLKILGSNMGLGDRQELTIKNILPTYKVKWEGVDSSEGQTAFLERDETGQVKIKATVDTGVEKIRLKKTIEVRDVRLNIHEWEGSVGETFDLYAEGTDSRDYEYDEKMLFYKDDHFIALRSGETDLLLRDGDTTCRCQVKVAGESSGAGDDVIAYAVRFLGNPYVYGGSSLTDGTDCSGFTMRIFEQFGVALPHSSAGQRSYGTAVSDLSMARAGDLICYNGHVAIYMGDGRIVHASNPRNDIMISDANYAHIITIRRLVE